ncbi:hypothetical protein GWK48_08295 [Metallosphaera tengchongensis]|uniref:Uncharacterized protein n=1 Tax=Metallosphaera tengchongensis TaxID=1532350 RepID=A0A6N0NYZ1_9CREN|nr:hypothetical protein [Metallosphaera tengchongensis]QKR00371.1 hypothetical protein GWK48_08295 [Metallosphaera tengchongensis]
MKTFQVALIAVILVIVVASVLVIHYRSGSGSSLTLTQSSAGPYFPTEVQVQSTQPGWKIVSLGEVVSPSLVSGLYPNADSVYQEFLEQNNNNNSVISITVVHYSGTPNGNQTIPHAVLGHYLILVNSTGNVSSQVLTNLLSLEKSVLSSGNGIEITIPSFMYPNSSTLPVVEYVQTNITSPQGNFTQYSEYLLNSSTLGGESVGINVLKGDNSTVLYNYLYSTASKLAVNGSLGGIKYFNISVNGTFGQVYYNVGLNGKYVVLIQSQPSPYFQAFQYIIEKV